MKTKGTVIALAGRRWQTRDALQRALGISRATFYRRVQTGAIEKAPDGQQRYRFTETETPRETPRETETETLETPAG